MERRWHRSLTGLACVGLLLAGCGDGGEGALPQSDRPASSDTAAPGGSTPPPQVEEDAAALVERALAARSADRSAEFAALLFAAVAACPDPAAASRLGVVAAVADRWSSALLEARPKAQAITEAQLAQVDWDALVAPCAAP